MPIIINLQAIQVACRFFLSLGKRFAKAQKKLNFMKQSKPKP